ncbi:MAG: MgtC/SapB family protein [Patescibacteria group bacterium]
MFETISSNLQLQMVFKLILAMLLGVIIGMERKRWKKPAGGRTFMLISLGSCLFTLVSLESAMLLTTGVPVDPTRIASNILTGIGFIGAGVIMHKADKVEGVTSAAAIWMTAAIGMAVAFNLYLLAVAATILAEIGLNFSYATRKFLEHNHDNQPPLFYKKEDEEPPAI